MDQDEKRSDQGPIPVLEEKCDIESEKDDSISKKEVQDETVKQEEIV